MLGVDLEWSGHAQRVQRGGLAHRRGKLQKATRAPVAVVVHTTGPGPGRRATDSGQELWRRKHSIRFGDALHAAGVIYTEIMEPGPHYVIGQDGRILQFVPESYAAWHVGGAGSRPYFTRPDTCLGASQFDWWRKRWPAMKTPRDLAGGHLWDPADEHLPWVDRLRAGMPLGSCNINTIGIEVVPQTHNAQGPWREPAWESLVRLVLDICQRHQIPVVKECVISHSDAHPLARTNALGRPWDPGIAQWSWDRFATIARTFSTQVEA
jgi:hypothetical protein